MDWKIDFTKDAIKQLDKLDRSIQIQIEKFVLKLEKADHPWQFGKGLKGHLASYWSYRVGDYRLICHIKEKELIIGVIRVDHRNKVYKKSLTMAIR